MKDTNIIYTLPWSLLLRCNNNGISFSDNNSGNELQPVNESDIEIIEYIKCNVCNEPIQKLIAKKYPMVNQVIVMEMNVIN